MKYQLKHCMNFLKPYVIKKEFAPVFSYHHLQKNTNDRVKMFDKIKVCISKNPSSLHSLYWNSSFQCTHSIVDFIHHADKYNCRLIVDVNPFDMYTRFLWKGVRRMYPDTLLFDTYCQSEYKSNTSENIKLYLTDGFKGIPRQLEEKTNVILATDYHTKPTYATWVFADGECQPILFVPLMN